MNYQITFDQLAQDITQTMLTNYATVGTGMDIQSNVHRAIRKLFAERNYNLTVENEVYGFSVSIEGEFLFSVNILKKTAIKKEKLECTFEKVSIIPCKSHRTLKELYDVSKKRADEKRRVKINILKNELNNILKYFNFEDSFLFATRLYSTYHVLATSKTEEIAQAYEELRGEKNGVK